MRGETVRKIQVALKAAGVDPGTIDGIFGPKTEAAVLGFQLEEGLVPDGEVGPETAGKLGIEL
jgi:peptidoglycan hydrolase-like protein with peptidoglycan-binding domain